MALIEGTSDGYWAALGLGAMALLVGTLFAVGVPWYRGQQRCRVERAKAALALLRSSMGLRDIPVSDSSFNYVKTYPQRAPVQCARGIRDGLQVDLVLIPDLDNDGDDGTKTLVGVACADRFTHEVTLARPVLPLGFDRAFGAVGPGFGPYTVWGAPTDEERGILEGHRAAILGFPRQLTFLTLNQQGVVLLWETTTQAQTEWESDVTVIEQAFSLGNLLCKRVAERRHK